MPLIPAKCTQCGAGIKVDDTKEAGICEYCGTAFITEKAINNYNTINNINADVVNIYNSSSEGFVIKAGVLEKYNGSNDVVVVPNNVKIIGKDAFSHLVGLVSVQIPDSVHTIEPYAFFGCKSLKTIILPKSTRDISRFCFSSCESLISIEIPMGCLKIECSAFSSCRNLKQITLPNSLEEIEGEAFQNCTSLESITIPASVKKIQGHGLKAFERSDGKYDFCSVSSCFSGCSSLKKVTFAGNNTEIDCSPYLSLFDTYTYQIEICAEESWKEQNEKKLSSTKAPSTGGCYVATCVYGSYDCPQVWTLRRYRDNTLASTWYGRAFIHTYYAISPILVKWFGNTDWFKKMWKGKLDRMVANLQADGVESTPYEDKDWQHYV